MPLYEYICGKCQSRSELLVRSATEKPVCPSCGSAKLERQLSTFAAHNGTSKPDACAAAGRCPGRGCPGSGCPMSE